MKLDQPYRNYAVDLLTPQNYPKDSHEPYDDVSWELPAHYKVDAIAIADRLGAHNRYFAATVKRNHQAQREK